MDYKELIEYKALIEDLRYAADVTGVCEIELRDAATAIETLLAEREAAVEDLRGLCWCCAHGEKWDKAPPWSKATTCEHMRELGVLARSGGKCKCEHWKWRGPTPPDRQ